MHTCAAVATAPGKAGISVIRLSGDDCIQIAEKVFFPLSKKKLSEIPANMAVYGDIRGKDNVKIDSGMCTCFYAPKSYTGENTVEISCHGSPVGTSLVLSLLLENGAKMALPGEFTKRAFVNGKLDLTQAEAVAQLIDAKSSSALKLSLSHLDGVIGKKISSVSDELTTLLASVYAYIDYPDEDLTDVSSQELEERLIVVENQLEQLVNSYAAGVAINEGVKTAIVGSPNTGKSSLLNLLAGFERAIVTDIAGTTRDVVTENVSVGGIMLKLSDTAGIRQTEDTVEKIGVMRSFGEMENSELVVAVFDITYSLEEKDVSLCQRLLQLKEDKKIIVVLNKCDVAKADEHKKYLEQIGLDNIAVLSAKTGVGKEQFERALLKLYPESQQLEEGLIITNARLHAALQSALVDIKNAVNALKMLTPDTACLDIEAALGSLLEADGRRVSEEIVNNIFSHFCVGK